MNLHSTHQHHEQPSTIHIQIQAYGAIERQLPESVSVECAVDTPISCVLDQIVEQYPQVQSAIERCACAIGEDIVSRQQHLKQNTQLVLLSPVAGG